MIRHLAVIVPAFLLAACQGDQEPEPAANLYEAQRAAIENRANAIEAQAENEVAAAEARLEAEANAFLSANSAEPANQSR